MALIDRDTLDFLLYDVLDAQALTQLAPYHDHSRETFSQTLDTATRVAETWFLPHNGKADEHEPQFDGDTVTTLAEVKDAFRHFVDAGLLTARLPFEQDGMQLPSLINGACISQFTAANPSSAAYPFLTMAAANLIDHFASDALKQTWLPLMRSGQATGTMVLTEPDVGSSLGDLTTSATPADDGSYRIRGQKMYISGGDHDLTDNIVHLVLARIKGAPAGTRGISLFLVPKWHVDDSGAPSTRNDVALAGLLHKMGYRGTTSTVLTFGEKDQCVGYLIGEAHQGLKYMFMMMNEARVGVGLGAASIACRGYAESLAYARERPQGRLPSCKDASSKPVMIIEHADVRRMLLTQKAYAEGALMLCLYGNRLIDLAEHSDGDEQRNAQQLLDLLTPVIKSWPSEFGLKANELAIQVLGGAGYIREYPVEQCYRDQRLNPIHEGTHGIQGLDLLGRKLWQDNSRGLVALDAAVRATIRTAGEHEELQLMAATLESEWNKASALIQTLGKALAAGDPDRTLANASVFLTWMGHLVVAWQWLWQAQAALASDQPDTFCQGKLQACRYFFRWELPQCNHWHDLLASQDDTCYAMPINAF
jgi:butyryl-CoA dehydrogenase